MVGAMAALLRQLIDITIALLENCYCKFSSDFCVAPLPGPPPLGGRELAPSTQRGEIGKGVAMAEKFTATKI
jgi:hypothetical protein